MNGCAPGLTLIERLIFIVRARVSRANERVHIHNIRDFPQGKLDSEINARFL